MRTVTKTLTLTIKEKHFMEIIYKKNSIGIMMIGTRKL